MLSFFITSVSSKKSPSSSIVSSRSSSSEQRKSSIDQPKKANESSNDQDVKDALLLLSPVMIANNYVETLGGLKFGVGFQFSNKGSLFYGKKVVFIDTYNRSYTLSDGSIIRMQPIYQ